LFAAQIDFLRTESKPFRFHKTERANNHIEQGDTLFFARNPIGVTYKRLPAMLTNAIHTYFTGKEHAIYIHFLRVQIEAIRLQQDFYRGPRDKRFDPSPWVEEITVAF
jgi:hypothetical protein